MQSTPAELVPFVVKRSAIHGCGLFATTDIPRGSTVWDFPIHRPETSTPSSNEATTTLSDGTTVNVSISTAKYFNHSCVPNCVTEVSGPSKFVVKALTNIQKGEELLFNYGYGMTGHENRPCRCGARECIGFIVSRQEWERTMVVIPQPQPKAQPLVEKKLKSKPKIEQPPVRFVKPTDDNTKEGSSKRSIRNKRAKARRKARKNRAKGPLECGQQLNQGNDSLNARVVPTASVS